MEANVIVFNIPSIGSRCWVEAYSCSPYHRGYKFLTGKVTSLDVNHQRFGTEDGNTYTYHLEKP